MVNPKTIGSIMHIGRHEKQQKKGKKKKNEINSQ